MDRTLYANAELSKFSRNYLELKRNLPIRPSEMGVINIITQTNGPHTPVQLARLLGVSKAMIAAHLSVLEEKGYIEKKTSLRDRRSFEILPTIKAYELARSAMEDTEGQLALLISKLGEQGFDELVRLISQANLAFEEGLK